jgi:hypothetical protein
LFLRGEWRLGIIEHKILRCHFTNDQAGPQFQMGWISSKGQTRRGARRDRPSVRSSG